MAVVASTPTARRVRPPPAGRAAASRTSDAEAEGGQGAGRDHDRAGGEDGAFVADAGAGLAGPAGQLGEQEQAGADQGGGGVDAVVPADQDDRVLGEEDDQGRGEQRGQAQGGQGGQDQAEPGQPGQGVAQRPFHRGQGGDGEHGRDRGGGQAAG